MDGYGHETRRRRGWGRGGGKKEWKWEGEEDGVDVVDDGERG